MSDTTEQEAFWQGNFGDDYIDRNRLPRSLASNLALFGKILGRTQRIRSVIELGANIGQNLMPLRQLLPEADLSAVEINKKAALELESNLPDIDLHLTSILEFAPTRTWDLVFTKGVLIHINPSSLPAVYETMYQSSTRYIFISEYYNPKPVEVPYRGHAGKLFKRDFAGEMLENYQDLSLIDYGFVYHRDPNFSLDDTNWFLMEKM